MIKREAVSGLSFFVHPTPVSRGEAQRSGFAAKKEGTDMELSASAGSVMEYLSSDAVPRTLPDLFESIGVFRGLRAATKGPALGTRSL